MKQLSLKMIIPILNFFACLMIGFCLISQLRAEENQTSKKDAVEVFIDGKKFKFWEEYKDYQRGIGESKKAAEDSTKMKTIIIPGGSVKEKTIILGKPPEDEIVMTDSPHPGPATVQKMRDFLENHFWPKATANFMLPKK
mgnify:CR=1 FL=1